MNFIDRAFWSHEEADRAQKCANNKQLRDAIEIAKTVIQTWSDSPGFLERQMRKVSINGLVANLENQVKTWEKNVQQAEQLAQQAKAVLEKTNNNPWDTEALEKALNLYQQSLGLMTDINWQTEETICQHKLKQKQNFQAFFNQGKEKADAKYYRKAIQQFEQAQTFFVTTELTKQIISCRQQLVKETQYEKAYNTAKELTKKGDFNSAIAQFQTAYTNFPRQDGKQLLEKLETVIQAKQIYKQGLIAEKLENWEDAKKCYFQAKKQLPQLTKNCSLRLAIIAIKREQWSAALQELNSLKGEESQYLRGYIYLKQGNYQTAYREWKSLSHPQIKKESEKLKTLVRREKLEVMRQIETAVNEEKLDLAETLSEEFLQKFGNNTIVEENLQKHIKPRMANLAWKTHTWQELAQHTETLFIQQQDITSLHNWAVATYYQAQAHPETMEAWITAWCTAIANLSQDPTLQDIPWLGSETIDFKQVRQDLKNLLGNTIDEVKDQNLDRYFILRDHYRRDIATLSSSLTINGLKILPSCYQRHQKYLPKPHLSTDCYSALYTQWGNAVAACLDGDIKRSFTLSPPVSGKTPTEKYGEMYVAYYQGSYYLQNQQWRKAKPLLETAKPILKDQVTWQQEIDRLSEEIIPQLSENEALQFTQFWYQLLATASACRYYVEQKADQIRNKLADQKISKSQGKKELEKLRKIDAENPVVLELLKVIKRIEDAEEISRLLDKPDLEGAVKKARSSDDERLKYMVAEICINIILEGLDNDSLYREEITRLARYAYSLCPNELEFHSIYQALNLI